MRALSQTRTGMRDDPRLRGARTMRGDRIGVHTDVFSLGVVLYELLVQRLPFDVSTRSTSEAERMIVEQDPPRPSAVARNDRHSLLAPISRTSRGDVDVLCLTAMHKDPARRYQSVEALIRDIDHYRSGEPLEARPYAFGYRAGKFGAAELARDSPPRRRCWYPAIGLVHANGATGQRPERRGDRSVAGAADTGPDAEPVPPAARRRRARPRTCAW